MKVTRLILIIPICPNKNHGEIEGDADILRTKTRKLNWFLLESTHGRFLASQQPKSRSQADAWRRDNSNSINSLNYQKYSCYSTSGFLWFSCPNILSFNGLLQADRQTSSYQHNQIAGSSGPSEREPISDGPGENCIQLQLSLVKSNVQSSQLLDAVLRVLWEWVVKEIKINFLPFIRISLFGSFGGPFLFPVF